MDPSAPSGQGKLWHWIKGHPYTAAAALTVLVISVVFFRRQQSEWQEVYLPAAAHLRAGEDMYRLEGGYLYPPFMAWSALPFLILPTPVARCAWLLVNMLCLFAILRWSWRLTGGGPLEGPEAKGATEHIIALLGGSCGLFYLQNCLAHQQTDIVIGAALVGGCLMLVRGRPILAASTLGLAAACKCTALLWIPYLLWRCRPLAALWLLVVALGVNLLPDLVSSTRTGRPWLAEYASRYLKPLTDSAHHIGAWRSDAVYNQSIAGAGHRFCGTSWTWTETDCTIQETDPKAPPQLLRAGVHGFQLMLLLVVLWTCGRPFRTISEDPNSQRQILECAIVLMLMVLLSPMSSKAHFGTLILPGFCLARAAVNSRSRLLWSALLGAVIMGILCNKDPLGERLYTLSMWYGLVTWQTLLLLGGCLISFRHEQWVVREQLPYPAAKSGSPNQAA